MVGVTCSLSIMGSGLIILSFIIFHELRTTIRYILFHLSIADFIVAGSNLFGAVYTLPFPNTGNNSYRDDPLCVAQATLTLFSTDSSILLTILFIVYALSALLNLKRYKLKRVSKITILNLLILFSWAFPFTLASVFAGKKYFGYRHMYSPRFCTVYISDEGQTFELLREIFGYEIFLYFSFLILPVLSVAFSCHLCYMVS